jgi:hypothetical protein
MHRIQISLFSPLRVFGIRAGFSGDQERTISVFDRFLASQKLIQALRDQSPPFGHELFVTRHLQQTIT